MKNLATVLAAAAGLGAVAFAPAGASAMPNGLAAASKALSADVENVHWVCGPYRCWWRPNYYAYGFYGPRRSWWGPGWRGRYYRW